jgi:hypothetical protein
MNLMSTPETLAWVASRIGKTSNGMSATHLRSVARQQLEAFPELGDDHLRWERFRNRPVRRKK